MIAKIKEKIKNISTDTILLTHSAAALTVLMFIFFCQTTAADELLYKFKSPSFSGINSSSHYLTIENQEATRKEAVREEIEAYKDELAREASNTTLARFIRNLESRIFAQLSRQMVEQLFGETPQKEGKLTLEGNTIEYIVETDTITLTITDESGGTTTITVPIGDFTF
tara:strand:- start:56 stop:562 length:507 start_codon:yes stop_codon:yes gene_type:complete